MPFLLKYIEDIAIEKNRDVIYIEVEPFEKELFENVEKFLEENRIPFQLAARSRNAHMYVSTPLFYIETPFDPESEICKKLAEEYEIEDGKMKDERIYYCLMTLEVAEHLSKIEEIDL